MGKEIDPSDIGKYPEIIKKAQAEIATMDVLVCGQCNSVFHFVEQFRDHKSSRCSKAPAVKDNLEARPVVWSFLLWRSAQQNQEQSKDQSNMNSWRVYQSWMKLDDAIKETWVVAGRTIQSFGKIGQGNLQETPVRITKTVVGNSPDALRGRQIVNNRVVGKPPPPSAKELDASFNELKSADKRPLVRGVQPRPNISRVGVKPGAISRRALRTISNTANGVETVEDTIEKILAKRFNPRLKEHEYLIKWENITHEQNTWEPASHLQLCPVLLDTFEKQLARQKEQRLALAAKQESEKRASDSQSEDDNLKRRKLDPSITIRKTESPITTRSAQLNKAKPNGVSAPIQVSKLIEKSAEVVITDSKDGRTTGIVKRVGATVNQAQKTEAQIKVIQKGGDSVSGVVRVNRASTSAASPGGRVLQKVGNTIVKPVQNVARSGVVSRQLVAAESKPTITRVMKSSPGAKSTPEQKIAALTRQGNLKITRKVVGQAPVSNTQQILIQGNEPFARSDSLPANITPTLVHISEQDLGQVLGQVEGEGLAFIGAGGDQSQLLTQEQHDALEQQQLQQGGIVDQNGLHQILAAGDDGTQQLIQFVTGEDGTIYQVAGKNEQGQTILIAQGADGEQQCVYVAANDSDVLGGEDGNNDVVSLEGSLISGNSDIQQQVQQAEDGKGQQTLQFAVEGQEGDQGISQALQVASEDGDSQDGQITAEVVQADLPSAGKSVETLEKPNEIIDTDRRDFQMERAASCCSCPTAHTW